MICGPRALAKGKMQVELVWARTPLWALLSALPPLHWLKHASAVKLLMWLPSAVLLEQVAEPAQLAQGLQCCQDYCLLAARLVSTAGSTCSCSSWPAAMAHLLPHTPAAEDAADDKDLRVSAAATKQISRLLMNNGRRLRSRVSTIFSACAGRIGASPHIRRTSGGRLQ